MLFQGWYLALTIYFEGWMRSCWQLKGIKYICSSQYWETFFIMSINIVFKGLDILCVLDISARLLGLSFIFVTPSNCSLPPSCNLAVYRVIKFVFCTVNTWGNLWKVYFWKDLLSFARWGRTSAKIYTTLKYWKLFIFVSRPDAAIPSSFNWVKVCKTDG